MDVIVKVRDPEENHGREDKGVQSKKRIKTAVTILAVCVCTDQQLSACEIADIYKLTDSAKL
mgnify:CR=1 FL=1